MTRTRVYQAGALLCGVLCVWNYILILKEDTLYQTLTPWVIHPPWLIYGIRLACVTAVGILLSAALRSEGRKKHTCFSIFTALMVVIYAVIMEAMTYNLSYQMQSLSVSLWPFATYGAACQTRQWMKNRHEKRDLPGGCGYFLAILMSVWFLETKMVRWGVLGRDPLEILYLLGMGAVSWKMTETEEKSQDSGKAMAAILFMCGLAFLAALFASDRVGEILESLKNPITSVTGNKDGINWLGYRKEVFMGAWRGDLSVMEELYMGKLSRGCPLAWISYAKGPVAMLLVLALETGLLYGVVSLAKKEMEEDPWQVLPGILAAALISRAVLGLAADLFLITSSKMGVLLLKNPGDIIAVVYLTAWPLMEKKAMGRPQKSA